MAFKENLVIESITSHKFLVQKILTLVQSKKKQALYLRCHKKNCQLSQPRMPRNNKLWNTREMDTSRDDYIIKEGGEGNKNIITFSFAINMSGKMLYRYCSTKLFVSIHVMYNNNTAIKVIFCI